MRLIYDLVEIATTLDGTIPQEDRKTARDLLYNVEMKIADQKIVDDFLKRFYDIDGNRYKTPLPKNDRGTDQICE